MLSLSSRATGESAPATQGDSVDANTLLIVEDSPIQAKIIRQRFESLSVFTLLQAYNRADAEQIAKQHRQDIFAAVVE